MSACPICGIEAETIHEEIEHMQAMHPEVIRERLEKAGLLADELPVASYFTDAERERMLWWLRRPVPPGPMKELDEAIIRKIERRR